MNQVIYRDGIKQAGPLGLAAEEATSRMDDVFGSLADTVSVEWELGKNADLRSVVLLRLFDSSGSVTAVFDPKELEESGRFRSRLRFLWGDLLEIRGRKLLAAIQGSEGPQGEN